MGLAHTLPPAQLQWVNWMSFRVVGILGNDGEDWLCHKVVFGCRVPTTIVALGRSTVVLAGCWTPAQAWTAIVALGRSTVTYWKGSLPRPMLLQLSPAVLCALVTSVLSLIATTLLFLGLGLISQLLGVFLRFFFVFLLGLLFCFLCRYLCA